MSLPKSFDDARWRKPRFPVLPRGWTRLLPAFELPEPDAQLVFGRNDGLLVVVDCSEKADGKFWTHVSMSHKHKLPSYEDMCEVKSRFIGDDRRAIQVFAPTREHVNIMATCLHLWACEDGDPLPDFTYGEETI